MLNLKKLQYTLCIIEGWNKSKRFMIFPVHKKLFAVMYIQTLYFREMRTLALQIPRQWQSAVKTARMVILPGITSS
jgi:hypothetical protein